MPTPLTPVSFTVLCAECVEQAGLYQFNPRIGVPAVNGGWTQANGFAALLSGIANGTYTVTDLQMIAVTYYKGTALCFVHAHSARYHV